MRRSAVQWVSLLSAVLTLGACFLEIPEPASPLPCDSQKHCRTGRTCVAGRCIVATGAPYLVDGGLDCAADLTHYVVPRYFTDFETDDGVWVEAVPPSGGTATVELVPGGLDGGGKSMRLTPLSGTGIFAVNKKRNDPAPNLELANGVQYCIQGWMRADATVGNGQVFYIIVRQYDESGALRTPAVYSATLDAGTAWQRVWAHIAPGADTLPTDYFDIRFRSDVNVQPFRVDEISIFRIPSN